ncbi:hypothetical protein [Microtetraspora malaysiensis]|uniref:hypothetical protein n=1 Tax=Microtetraspora malaysiensis TaxID=161358 RepID=UPI003D94E778
MIDDSRGEAWYWTSGWQSDEAEADADIREDRTRVFDTMDDLFAEIDDVRKGRP